MTQSSEQLAVEIRLRLLGNAAYVACLMLCSSGRGPDGLMVRASDYSGTPIFPVGVVCVIGLLSINVATFSEPFPCCTLAEKAKSRN